MKDPDPGDQYLKLCSVRVNDVHHDAIIHELAEEFPGSLLGLHEDEHRRFHTLEVTRRMNALSPCIQIIKMGK